MVATYTQNETKAVCFNKYLIYEYLLTLPL